MRTSGRRRARGAAVLAVLALGWVFFAPVQLGGSTLYTATVGDSMEPMFHKGDLALVRRASSYTVGDVVLYQSPVLHRPVLHRVLVVQHGRYYFQGDNNDFVDPGYATRGQIMGKLWHGVPRAGEVLNWFGRPSHSALLTGAAMAFLLLGGGSASTRRRKRPPPRQEAADVRPLSRIHFRRPRKTVENVVGLIALLVSVVLLVVGFTSPLSRPAKVNAYAQSGVFSYRAKVARPATAYPSGVARTGDPLFLNAFRLVNVEFHYRFRSGLPHAIKGTVALKAVISADSGLHNTYTLKRATPFTGDAASVRGTLDVQELRGLITQLSIDTGTAGASYSVELTPVVRVRGAVGGKQIRETFAPTLPFVVDQAVLKLNVAAPLTAPGATYAPPSAAETLAVGLKPSRIGTTAGIAPNYASLARYHFAISVVRGAGLGFAGLALLALVAKLFRPQREVWSHERRLAFRFECVLVDVVSFRADEPQSRPAIEVPDFESLATLARFSERPILRETVAGVSSYAVEDDGRLYVHHPAAEAAPAQVFLAAGRVAASPAPAATSAAPRALRRVSRPVGALVALGVAATLVTTYTATTTVPLSRAGGSTHARQVAELSPAECAAVAATSLLTATTSTTSGTSGSDLILGRQASGTQNLNGSGGNDCLVGGGGAGTINKFNGGSGSGDVCIGGPGAANTFSGCETQY